MFIHNMDEFEKHDKEKSLIPSVLSLPTLHFLARAYTQDSKLYPRTLVDYWLEYLNACAVQRGGDKGREWVRRAAALRACTLIDQGTKDSLEEARDLLESLLEEDYPLPDPVDPAADPQQPPSPMEKYEGIVSDPEVDNRVLVYSLLGMLKKATGKTQKEQIDGVKL
jgi:hypothetical protein